MHACMHSPMTIHCQVGYVHIASSTLLSLVYTPTAAYLQDNEYMRVTHDEKLASDTRGSCVQLT